MDEIIRPVIEALQWLWAMWQVKFLISHIAINTVAAIAVSIYTSEFRLGKLGEFLYRKLIPYILIFAAVAALGEAANLAPLADIVWLSLEAQLLADLLDNLKKIGIEIPDWLTK